MKITKDRVRLLKCKRSSSENLSTLKQNRRFVSAAFCVAANTKRKSGQKVSFVCDIPAVVLN